MGKRNTQGTSTWQVRMRNFYNFCVCLFWRNSNGKLIWIADPRGNEISVQQKAENCKCKCIFSVEFLKSSQNLYLWWCWSAQKRKIFPSAMGFWFSQASLRPAPVLTSEMVHSSLKNARQKAQIESWKPKTRTEQNTTAMPTVLLSTRIKCVPCCRWRSATERTISWCRSCCTCLTSRVAGAPRHPRLLFQKQPVVTNHTSCFFPVKFNAN